MAELVYSSTIGKVGNTPKHIKPIFISELIAENNSFKIVSRKVTIKNNKEIINLYPSVTTFKQLKVKEALESQNATMNALKKINTLFK